MLLILQLLILLRLGYWLFIFSKLARYKQDYSLNRKEPVSVVICVKNNIEGLQLLIPKILKQNHEAFEIIVADDFSDTNKIELYVSNLKEDRVRYTKPEKNIEGKKLALTKGVNTAKYPWILVTDSDCLPSSLDWISHMVSIACNDNKKIVLGYGPLKPNDSWISFLAQYETAYIAMQYLSFALLGMPYMGVGRNLLFSKDLFLNSHPYKNNIDIASGDDDFFIQNAATTENTAICIHHNAHSISEAPSTFNSWINKKIRQVSTSPHYKNNHKIFLAIFGFLHISIYLFIFIGAIFSWITITNLLASWLLMMAIMFIIQYACFSKLKSQKSMSAFMLSDILLSLLYSLVAISSLTKKNIKWS